MPGEVTFWPTAWDSWGDLMAGGRAGRGREQGPAGPHTPPTETLADADLFVVAGGGRYVLFRAGTYIPQGLVALPRVSAVWQAGVLVPGS